MKSIFKQVAERHGTTEQEVEAEITSAIKIAMKSEDPNARAFWKAVAPDGKMPPIEKVLTILASMIE
ncbi:MAG: sporulation initiation factor Spo0A C-terminal domain-containing protein [Eubacterium sp.]